MCDMVRFKIWVVIFGTLTLCNAVRINMQGSVSMGKEVLETISHYIKRSVAISRRSMNTAVTQESDIIKYTVQTANICNKSVKVCSGKLGNFVRDYVTLLASAVETIFEEIISSEDDKYTIHTKGTIFVEELKPTLNIVNNILNEFNQKDEDEDDYEWRKTVKKISAIFLKSALEFVKSRLDGHPNEIEAIKKKLRQKLVISVILSEARYEKRLCDDHEICNKDHKVTIALNTVLGQFANLSNDKSKEFIKNFYESLPTDIFNFLGPVTMHELQVILSDLSYTSNTPAKDVLVSVSTAVDARMKYINNKEELSKGFDQQLVNIILSDMDHFYISKKKTYPFDLFLESFDNWVRNGGKLTVQMKQLIKEIGKKLSAQEKDLLQKLTREVKVFLELTVDVD